jgi:hypothetical protein
VISIFIVTAVNAINAFKTLSLVMVTIYTNQRGYHPKIKNLAVHHHHCDMIKSLGSRLLFRHACCHRPFGQHLGKFPPRGVGEEYSME